MIGLKRGTVRLCEHEKDKLVAAPDGMYFTAEEIADAVKFQEQYYDSEIEIMNLLG